MAHTPGPWSLRFPRSNSLNGAQVFGADGAHVASLTTKADKPLDQKGADARLIASAPDMLKALKRIQQEHRLDIIDAVASAVIAKAEGR